MFKYELMFITRVIGTDILKAINDELTRIINANGDVNKLDVWGEKALAYEIDGQKRGIYTLVTFDGNCGCISAIDHFMKIKEDVLRYMIIKKCV